MQTFEREIILDTETTGLSEKEGHRIIEVAAVEVIGSEETGRVFHRYYNPGRDIPEEASRIHGITEEMVADKPYFEDEAQELAEFIDGATLVIHNAPFDMAFLRKEFEYAGITPNFGRVVDTLQVARKRYPSQSNTLDALCDRLGVDRSQRDVHGGLIDVKLLFQVYVKILGRDQLIPIEMASETVAGAGAAGHDAMPDAARQSWFPLRPAVPPTEEEVARHAAFLEKKLGGKNLLWGALVSV